MFAAHHKIDNLIATVDWNGQQIDGPVDKVIDLGNLGAKFDAFGWQVLYAQGNNMAHLLNTLAEAKTFTGKGKPIVILMRTAMGFGVDFMLNDHNWHGSAPNDAQLEKALAQLPETLGDY
jgi:transketolase